MQELGNPVHEIGRQEKELIARILAGDEPSFERFVDDYYPRLYRFAWLRLDGDAEAAQDVVQDTFSKVITRLSYYRGEAALFSWLCTFCRYEIAAYWRTRARRAAEVPLLVDTPNVRAALECLAMGAQGPESEVERRQVATLVRRALDHLPTHYGDALEERYLRGRSVAQIADRMGLSYKAAESLLSRARKAFREGFAGVLGGATS